MLADRDFRKGNERYFNNLIKISIKYNILNYSNLSRYCLTTESTNSRLDNFSGIYTKLKYNCIENYNTLKNKSFRII